MIHYFQALLIGIIAGLRTFSAPAAISWAAHFGRIALHQSALAFLGSLLAALIFAFLALVEFVTDQLPTTPHRTVPTQFGARLVSGALCGAAIGVAKGAALGGLLAGIVGAAAGTFGGHHMRMRLARAFGRDLPAALIEDVIAIIGAILIVAWV